MKVHATADHLASATRSPLPRHGRRRLRVAIVGGGASGTLTAIHLLRGAGGIPLEITLLDAAGSFGPGVAYGTEDPLHLLNVPAVRMGGIASYPDHFHKWLRQSRKPVDPEEFVPRSLYGEYLEALLESAALANSSARLDRRTVEVCRLATGRDFGEGVTLSLAGGEEIEADRAVLAIGPLPGGNPVPVPPELRDSGAYIANPCQPGAMDVARDAQSVLIVGTGLTMVDVALSLAARRPNLQMLAVSRHGILPRSHRRELTAIEPFPIPIDEGTLEQVAVALLERITVIAQEGGDWRDAIDSARATIPAVWRALELDERRRFLTRFQRLWEAHRFRVAPASAGRVESLRLGRQLDVCARRVARLEQHRGRVRAWLDGGDAGLGPVDVDLVVNCCGPGTDIRRTASPLIAGMLADGSARPDPLGLGLDVGRDGSLLNASGAAQASIHVVGALRRGVEWEATSVTEIREHAAVVAQAICATQAM